MVRNEPGRGVRQKMNRVLLSGAVLCGFCLGLATGLGIYWVLGEAVGWEAWPAAVLCASVLSLMVVVWRTHLGSWTLASGEKGVAGERIVGGTIEEALMRPTCAVFHSVPGTGDRGEIDHVVVTPAGVWVVETKYKWVPRKRYRAVMQRLALNVKSMRKTLGPRADVRGCLILATVRRRKHSSYTAQGVRLSVFSAGAFEQQLRQEAASEGVRDERLIRTVRKMAA